MTKNNLTTPSSVQYRATKNDYDKNDLKKKRKRPNFPDFKQNHKNGHPSIVTEWELVCDK